MSDGKGARPSQDTVCMGVYQATLPQFCWQQICFASIADGMKMRRDGNNLLVNPLFFRGGKFVFHVSGRHAKLILKAVPSTTTNTPTTVVDMPRTSVEGNKSSTTRSSYLKCYRTQENSSEEGDT